MGHHLHGTMKTRAHAGTQGSRGGRGTTQGTRGSTQGSRGSAQGAEGAFFLWDPHRARISSSSWVSPNLREAGKSTGPGGWCRAGKPRM